MKENEKLTPEAEIKRTLSQGEMKSSEEVLSMIDSALRLADEVQEETPVVEKQRIADEMDEADEAVKKHGFFRKVVGNLVFYLMLILIVFGAFLASEQDGRPKNIFGYSYFTVLTTSMQSEIPKGSLVITKNTPADEIKKNQDITFFKDQDTTITHRVVEIFENYSKDEKGNPQRAFRTKGIENPAPDKDLVMPANIIGVVVFSSPFLGFILSYVKQNIIIVIIMFTLIVFFIKSLRVYFKSGKETTNV